MDIFNLARAVQESIERDPPEELVAYCEPHYSPYYNLLRLLAWYMTAGICVELGVETGRGSFAMCLGGATVYGMDHTRRPEMAVLQARFPGKFHFVEQPSLPIPQAILDQPEPISILHIDTEHSYSMAREEFNAYQPLLSSPAVVCFDDTHAQESAVGHFVATLPYPTIFDDRLHECGYAVMLYSEEGA